MSVQLPEMHGKLRVNLFHNFVTWPLNKKDNNKNTLQLLPNYSRTPISGGLLEKPLKN